ncbi:MAG: hypothetical protein GY765_42175, partial [bacterium]|nr:hypothetical protein [bacterium]
MRQGTWIGYDPYGNNTSEKHYENGTLKSESLWEYSSGTRLSKYTHIQYNGLNTAKREIRYYEDQTRLSDFNYLNDVLHGSYTKWNYADEITDEGMFKNGKLDGTRIWNSGPFRCEAEYSLGRLHGKYVEKFLADGRLWVEANYQNDKLNGSYKIYHGNGEINQIGSYTDNIRTGDWAWYNENGVITEDGKFDDTGMKSGLWRTFRNTILHHETTWSQGEMHGKSRRYYQSGDGVMEEVTYMYGVLHGPVERFCPNGNTSEEYRYENGMLQGSYTGYYCDGALQVTGQYNRNMKTGEWKQRHASGRTFSISKYSYGQLGRYKSYHDRTKEREDLKG